MWTYRPQKRQVGSAFALTYILLLRSCKLMGVFIIAPLPPLWMELLLHNSRASSLHGRYPASTLLLAPPPPSRRPLTSRCCRLYRFLFRRFLDGTRRASPVAQCILVIVLSLPPRQSVTPLQPVCDVPCCLRPTGVGSASEVRVSGSPVRSLSLRPDDSLAIPKMALSIDFRSSVSFPPAYPSYRTLTFVLVGLTPTGFTYLSWTYSGSSPFSAAHFRAHRQAVSRHLLLTISRRGVCSSW